MNQSNISKFGGKAASLIAQYDAGNIDFLFPFILIEREKKRPNFAFKGLQIVRGSAIGDEKGLVDKIKTIHNVSANELSGKIDIEKPKREWRDNYLNTMMSVHGIRQINDYMTQNIYSDDEIRRLLIAMGQANKSPIDEIIMASQKEDLIKYAAWEGSLEYDGVKSVIISPQNKLERRGTIIEHPNMKGYYVINVVNQVVKDTSFYGKDRIYMDQILADSFGNIVQGRSNTMKIDTTLDEVKAIVRMKQKSKEVGFLSHDISTQVEFGFLDKSQKLEGNLYEHNTSPKNSIIFYQERAFRPFEYDERFNPNEYRFNIFGKIPEKGLKLRIVKAHYKMDKDLLSDGVPSLYMPEAVLGAVGESHYEVSMQFMNSLEFMPNNLEVFFMPFNTLNGDSLEHQNFNWASKAKYSLLKKSIRGKIYSNEYKTGEKINLKYQDIM